MTFEERFYVLQARGRELSEQQAQLLASVDMEPALFDRALEVIAQARRELDQELRQLRAEMVEAGFQPGSGPPSPSVPTGSQPSDSALSSRPHPGAEPPES